MAQYYRISGKAVIMVNLFRFMRSTTGRIIRILIGITLIAWGFSVYWYPERYIIMGTGIFVLIMAFINWSLMAWMSGFPLKSKDMLANYGGLKRTSSKDGIVHPYPVLKEWSPEDRKVLIANVDVDIVANSETESITAGPDETDMEPSANDQTLGIP